MQLGVLFGGMGLGGGMGMKLAVMGASVAGSLLLGGGGGQQIGKLNDVRVSSSSYGRGIPEVWGTMRVTGNIFWATDFEETKRVLNSKGKEKTGKKADKKMQKGKADEYYEYHANFAVGLCAGPMDSVIRVWADNNLIYNKLNPNDEDIVEIGFSQESSQSGKGSKGGGQTKKGSRGESGRFRFRFKSGAETQAQDSFMVEKQGAALVPAYRGLCYLFFEHFALQDFGNRIPTITAEVAKSEERAPYVQTLLNIAGTDRDNWNPGTGSAVKGWIGPGGDRMYIDAYGTEETPEEGRVLRVYDLTKSKEIIQWHYDTGIVKSIDGGLLPPFPQSYTDVFSTYAWAPIELDEAPWRFLGVNGKDEIVMQSGGPNYGPVHWFDVNTFRGKSVFGQSGILGGSVDVYVAIAYEMQPCIWQEGPVPPEVMDAIIGTTSDITIFNHRRVPQVRINPQLGNGVIGTVLIGYYKDDYGLFFTTTNIYGHGGRVYFGTFKYRQFITEPAQYSDGVLAYTFPYHGSLSSGEEYIPEGYKSDILYMAYCVPLEKIVMVNRVNTPITINIIVDGVPTDVTYEAGLYAIVWDPNEEVETWRMRLGPTSTPFTAGGFFKVPNVITTEKLSWVAGSSKNTTAIYTLDFGNEKFSSFSTRGQLPGVKAGQYYWAAKDAVIYLTDDADIDPNDDTWIYCHIDRRQQGTLYVSDICEDLAEAAGIPRSQIDTSLMSASDTLIGYAIENPTPIRDALRELSSIFQFDVIESDYTLKFIRRGRNHIIVIPQEDLGVVQSEIGETENDYYIETRQQEVELPERVTLSYINSKEDYEVRTAHFKRPSRPFGVMKSEDHLELNVNMAISPSNAKQIARRILFSAWNERTTHEYVLPPDYLWLDPSDTIRIYLDNGELFEDRITDIEIGADFSMHLYSVSQHASMFAFPQSDGMGGFVAYDPDASSVVVNVYDTDAESDDIGGVIPINLYPAPRTRPQVFNIPYLTDSDVDEQYGFTYYYGIESVSAGFRYGSVYRQLSGNYDQLGGTVHDLVWGYAAEVPPPPSSHHTIDYDSVITLMPAYDYNAAGTTVYEWESADPANWPNLSNMIVIGEEIILFRDVDVQPDGTVQISTLVRGYRGTINAAEIHQQNEKFWIVMNQSFRDTQTELSDIGVEYRYHSTSMGFTNFLPDFLYKELDGATLKPMPVGSIKRTTNGAGNTIMVDWERGTRYDGAMIDGTGTIPLNEDSEQYDFYLMKAFDSFDPRYWDPDDTSKYWFKAAGLTNSQYTISSAQLTAAGLTHLDTIYVVIIQKSAKVGDGFPQWATLNYSLFNDFL